MNPQKEPAQAASDHLQGGKAEDAPGKAICCAQVPWSSELWDRSSLAG